MELAYEKYVKTRKPHKCECCWQRIDKGEVAIVCSGKYDGHFFRYYLCDPCNTVMVCAQKAKVWSWLDWEEVALNDVLRELEQDGFFSRLPAKPKMYTGILR